MLLSRRESDLPKRQGVDVWPALAKLGQACGELVTAAVGQLYSQDLAERIAGFEGDLEGGLSERLQALPQGCRDHPVARLGIALSEAGKGREGRFFGGGEHWWDFAASEVSEDRRLQGCFPSQSLQ